MSQKNKKILVLGATGAMGQYLVPELLKLGYEVDGVSLIAEVSHHPALRYLTADAKDRKFLEEILLNHYDGIVDFMTYSTEEFRQVYPLLLDHTNHYIFLSSCRVYDDCPPIRESSPRLLESSKDKEFLATDDYSLFKAKEEDLLRNSAYSNWTIVRPATTYSRGRFQLVTLESQTFIHRMLAGKTVVLPEEAMDCRATLSWGGDVAKMIALLMFREDALREDFIVATGEHRSWKEILEYYQEIHPFSYKMVKKEDYLEILGPGHLWTKYQLIYARMFQRITDNTKILSFTGMKQENLMPLRDGLRREYQASQDIDWSAFADTPINQRMDAWLLKKGF